MARREARRIWLVHVSRYETEEHTSEAWEDRIRFSSERAAQAFSRRAQKLDELDYVSDPYVGPVWQSGMAAFAQLVDEIG